MVAQQKLPQILQLTPSSEIVFEGPFEHVVTSYLELKNPSDQRVCFKVKTTAPRRYCVRPNSGIVEPKGKIKIAIMLQPMDADSQAERNKHKFMVQSTIINGGDKDSRQTDEIWQSATPEEIMDSKLRCVFQAPDQEQQQQESSPSKRTTEPVAEAVTTPPAAAATSAAAAAAAATTTTSQQQPAARNTAGDKPSSERMVTSTPVASRVTSSTSKPSSYSAASASAANVSAALSANRSSADKSSFLHPMGDDYKIVLVSLAMLILGVILGKYII